MSITSVSMMYANQFSSSIFKAYIGRVAESVHVSQEPSRVTTTAVARVVISTALFFILTVAVGCKSSPESPGAGSNVDTMRTSQLADEAGPEPGLVEEHQTDSVGLLTLEGTQVVLSPREAARLEGDPSSVSLCRLLDSVSVKKNETDAPEIGATLLIHLSKIGTIDLDADSMLVAVSGVRRYPDYHSFNPRLFYGSGCGVLKMIWRNQSFEVFLSVFRNGNSLVALLREKNDKGLGADPTGNPVWAVESEGSFVDVRLKGMPNISRSQKFLRLEVSDSKARLERPGGSRLFLNLERLQRHATWSHANPSVQARYDSVYYPHVLKYECLSGIRGTCLAEEEVGASDPPTVTRYVPYRVDGERLHTPDTTLVFTQVGP